VPTFQTVEALDIIEDAGLGVVPPFGTFRAQPAPVFNDGKKLSIAALSQTLPDRLIEQTTP
jgi:hypothetical protein